MLIFVTFKMNNCHYCPQIASLPPFQPTPPAAASVTPNPGPRVAAPRPAHPGGALFSTFDWLIVVIVLAIAALIYRRFGVDLDDGQEELR